MALATDDASALYAELAADGIAADAPLDFSRPVESLGEARFRIVQLPPDASPGCRTFACQHFTREFVWRPEYRGHANGATQIAAVAVVVEDTVRAASAYANLFGARPQTIDEGLLVQTAARRSRSPRAGSWDIACTAWACRCARGRWWRRCSSASPIARAPPTSCGTMACGRCRSRTGRLP